jgi:phage baseplate assembly protein W
MPDFVGTGLAFPLRVDRRGALALVHGDDDVREAIEIILGTAPGERPMRPEFGCGIHDFVFESIDPYTIGRLEREVRVALDRWEPRIDVQEIAIDTDGAGRGELLIDISYTIRATNAVHNLVYPFYVIPAEEPS